MNSSTERRIALVVEYDGTRYCGFQLQTNAPTIQAELERAALRLTGEPIRVKGASRTDSGAHALGQVVALCTWTTLPVSTFVSGMNTHLPTDISVREAHQVDPSFDPRRDATSRVYRYTILNRPVRSPGWDRWAYQVPKRLDVETMGVSLRCLEGSHDFAAFGGALPAGRSSVRQMLDTRVWREDDRVLVEMEANAFLPGQVRRTIGMLVEVGRGRLSPEGVRAIIDGRSQETAAMAVPARGLCLMQINYKDFPAHDSETNENL